jgi:hypothetical protein
MQDIEKGTVNLANRSSLSGDLILGADGERVSAPLNLFASAFVKANNGFRVS